MKFDIMELFVYGLPIWVIVRVISLINKYKNKEKYIFLKEIIVNLFVLYLFILISLVILPIDTNESYFSGFTIYEKMNINLLPFKDFLEGEYKNINLLKNNLVGNTLLLFPFTLYLCLIKSSVRNIKKAIAVTFLISLSIEIIQLIMNCLSIVSQLRAVDIDDLIMNTLGGFIAYIIFKLSYRGKLKYFIDKIYINKELNSNSKEVLEDDIKSYKHDTLREDN
ncbi:MULTISPECIES: VanZ family protein [unclassified Clostridioides]|uniref:VanZ family protein n=1 Tax=unclassified Clostridioides TaxID=2635829 RepID=UPI001D126C39|nr:VanZ family protein [Clostridioides sp. ZZV14-6150]MCC0658968.1 VanZ family protein [Clostridioides sp. ZZV14-6154]MCC0670347.1 VanZ family protein [Clostridioides sp. ZZV14-6153]MCC0720106.1 VanZ family protein [Clostridioides sp. ZZV14-6105]MCC0723642.1 VanZ family protein [Clostridioides sp. ZZV14-6104]MCC0728903.1 VanZ family protein [Clostridioides sp. ZZV14-6045]MCC0730236.1 VanZ family protein [Clostridioides sp. ZZV14-6048]MCC0734620.1 VanZ family protein [Clostridioides sp. ZZV14